MKTTNATHQIQTIAQIQAVLANERSLGRSIGFVPTMGALHEGHLSLIEQARKDHDVVVVSIFVNPLQFGEGEDFETYPRDIHKDQETCQEAGVDYVFYPSVEEMYPDVASVELKVVQGVDVLCGKSRPGHFDGMATVVLKLFHIIQPDTAYFGQKDAQQVAVVKQMVKTLAVPVSIHACPTVRESDGLAKSSRNVYLTAEERKQAPMLYQSLLDVKPLALSGAQRDELISFVRDRISTISSGEIDYVDVLSYPKLEAEASLSGTIIIALAYQFSRARLIDHILIEV
ncbi:pantoate--beta-alanine ligase [Alkalicoccobacillus murimartini]|uniref:Pantothenate synthetase n=1 Tax=Alkalicoccobacillus murimartini TaxID=171685 RepID=A0ABT9YEN5_9BACI|nr:pantoate--beta-alanine ligase [Alkalicoccobacillus murimartini]MDQ0205950.1 pantoate--beta-alanine ligase [Alkalicoccobacillus murimartini]